MVTLQNNKINYLVSLSTDLALGDEMFVQTDQILTGYQMIGLIILTVDRNILPQNKP